MCYQCLGCPQPQEIIEWPTVLVRASDMSIVDEFRVYVIAGKMRGMCQKNPSFLAGKATLNQVTKAEEISQLIMLKVEQSQK